MACSNQMDNNETHIYHEEESHVTFDNEQPSSDNDNHRQRRTSILDSGIASRGSNTPNSLSGQEVDSFRVRIAVSLLFHRIIKRCASSIMKIHGSSNLNLEEAVKQLLNLDDELEAQWHKTWHIYWHDRHCQDYQRIENEIYQCFNALINDDKTIMIGLDSISSFKHLLITSMRICSEPNFKIEIRIGFGGTIDPLNLRVPSYVIAGVYVLEKLLKLRQKFPSNQSKSEENIPTEMLINRPVLTIFCSWSAAVTVNHFDKNTTKQNADAILSYIKMYIDHLYPTSVTNYIRYEMDHENTYEINLLNRIIKHFHLKYDDNIEEIKQQLITTAKKYGSNEEGSIRYSSMHLIGAKDIIDKNASQPLMHSFDQNDQLLNLYDCIITVGGSVETRFNQLRYTIRQVFMKESIENNEDNYHFPLSIRMLSKAGAIPVYYSNKPSDITVDDVLQGRIKDLKLTDRAFDGIKLDISILREDIGVHLFDRSWTRITEILKTSKTQSDKIPSWKDVVLALIDLCLKVWEEHAKDNRICICSIQDRTPLNQVCEHYNLSYDLNDDGCSIIKNILDVLQHEIGVPFSQTVEHLSRVWKRKNGTGRLFHKLDDILDQLVLDFVRQNFPNENN